MAKSTVTLGGVPLVGNSGIGWQLTTGTAPFQTTFQVTTEDWKRLAGRTGQDHPLDLEITDHRDERITIRHVYILHRLPSDSEARVTFLVADRRWLLPYSFILRDFNITKKSGDRSYLGVVPFAVQDSVDLYDFKEYSLRSGTTRWDARSALESVLSAAAPGWWFVESFPTKQEQAIQNVVLRDTSDVAIQRMLSFVPGAEVYCDTDGFLRIIDATDLSASEEYRKDLPPELRDGQVSELVDRSALRPRNVKVHYVREVECAFTYADAITKPPPDPKLPYMENVMPTVDPETDVLVRDPITGKIGTVTVPMGTWVQFDELLSAWNNTRPAGCAEWKTDTIRKYWVSGGLEGILGGTADKGIPDLVANANISMRVAAIRAHWRRTFRINPRYVDRIRDIQAVRVSPLDPVTGARAASPVWAEMAIIPTSKGEILAPRKDGSKSGWTRNVSSIPGDGENLRDYTQSPARVSMIDRDQGILRVDFVPSMYGTDAQILPSPLVNSENYRTSGKRNLSRQKDEAMGFGMVAEGRVNGLFLDYQTSVIVLLTIVVGAPNNTGQLHTETVNPDEAAKLLNADVEFLGGTGPDLEVFVTPNEATVRHQWKDDGAAEYAVRVLLGTDSTDPSTAGFEVGRRELPGFAWVNENREIKPHARSVAAEALSAWIDQRQGQSVTTMPETLVLRGNISTAGISVGAAPSAAVRAIQEYSPQPRRIDRFATLSDSARKMVLGILPFWNADR